MAFIFDFDGTIIRNRAFKYAILTVPKLLGLDIDTNSFYNAFLETYYRLVAIGRPKKAFDWDFVCEITVRSLGREYRRNLFRELMLRGIQSGFVEIINNSYEVLQELKKRGLKLGLLTNGYSWYQKPALRVSGLDKLFDFTVFLDQLPEPKPSELAFYYAKQLARDTYPLYFVGDHPYYDIYGALKANFEQIFWITKEIRPKTYFVRDLRNIFVERARRYGKTLDLRPFENKKIIVINTLRALLDYT